MRIGAMRKGIGCLLALFLPLLLLLPAGTVALAKGKAYVAVFYREFEDPSDPEAADLRTALNEALADVGIAYQEYDGKGDPAIQSAQVAEERDAMFLLVNLAGQDTEDAAGEILAAAGRRPVIFFDCEISRETADAAEDLCILVNAVDPKQTAEDDDQNASEWKQTLEEDGRNASDTEDEPDTETEATEAESLSETEREAESLSETERKADAAGPESSPETEQETETESPEKNIEGMAEAIALIAGNYMTGAGFFEGIEEAWITDDWRVDVP